MAATQITVKLTDTWAIESPLTRKEGITETFSLKVLGAGTLSSVSAKAYKKKVDVTSTVFPSGSVSISSNVATLKPATGFIGTSVYVIDVTGTEGGNVHVWSFIIKIQKATAEQ